MGRMEYVGGWLMKIVTKKIEPMFLIFSAVIFVTHFSINGIENLKFSKLFDKEAIRKFEGPTFAMGKFSKMLDEDTILRI